MTKLDLTKPVQTRSGLPVRILCTDAKGVYPVIGVVARGEREEPSSWDLNGWWNGKAPTAFDLINIPPRRVKREGWVNITKRTGFDGAVDRIVRNGAIWPTERRALIEAEDMRDVIDTRRIEWEEDEAQP